MAHGWKPGACNWEYLLPGIWARLVVSESAWSVDRLDRTFFPALASGRKGVKRNAKLESGAATKGSSALRRYLACQSKINFSRYSAAENPFLQIDSCWEGTFRFLSAPFVALFHQPASLKEVERTMLLVHINLRQPCFSGVSNAMRRTFLDPEKEVAAIAQSWRAMDSPRLRKRYFPDILAMALGWVHEAVLLGERSRLRLIQGDDVLPRLFGISFHQLDFLEPDFARFLDLWLQIGTIENLDRDPYPFAVEYEAHRWILEGGRCPVPKSPLELAALLSTVFCGQAMTGRMLAEDLDGKAIPVNTYDSSSFHKGVSWDRAQLKEGPKKRKPRES